MRSHTRDPGNETADFLAKLGADTDDLSNVYNDDELLTLAKAEYKRVADGARRPSLATLRTPYPTRHARTPHPKPGARPLNQSAHAHGARHTAHTTRYGVAKNGTQRAALPRGRWDRGSGVLLKKLGRVKKI